MIGRDAMWLKCGELRWVLTGNGIPPMEGGFLSRILDMLFTTKDQHKRGTKESEEFQAWLTPELDKMGVLGDFTYFYIIEHQDILKKPWKDAGIEFLEEFYKWRTWKYLNGLS